MSNFKIEVGAKISVTLPKFEGPLNEYKVISTTVKNHSFGTIQLEYIKETRPHTQDVNYKSGERTMIVEELWFNVPDHRTIKII